MQGGALYPVQFSHAAIWHGSTASAISLHPPGAWISQVLALGPGYQVGSADLKAALWYGTPDSFVDLNPDLATGSSVNACWGSVQAGKAEFPGPQTRAGIWSGTAASWVSFHPGGDESSINGYDGSQFVGYYNVSAYTPHALVWGSTPGSFVDLNPIGYTNSWARAVANGRQGGTAYGRAALWSGSAASFIDLTPAVATGGEVYAMSGEWQVGEARINGLFCAAVWQGTPGSFENLSEYLPLDYRSESHATGIWRQNGVTYVSGWARNTAVGRIEAVLWRNPAIPSSVLGIIALTDIVWSPVYPRTITVKVMQGEQTLAQKQLAVATTAGLSLNVSGAGPAVVTIDGPTQLKRRRYIFLDGNPVDLGSIVLLNGDVDGSGEVDAADIDATIMDFGAAAVNADIDLSGEVDAADIDIVISNFGLTDE